MSYRSSSPPISGFAGHVPGSKWRVGGNHQQQPQQRAKRTHGNSESTLSSEELVFDAEGNPIANAPASGHPPAAPSGMQPVPSNYAELYQQQMAAMQQNGQMPYMMPMYGFNPAYSMNGYSQNGTMTHMNPMGSQMSMASGNSSQPQNGHAKSPEKTRSKSVPRKPKSDVRDIFGGIEGGWWSEGQALRNIRRHQQGLAESNGFQEDLNGSMNGAMAAAKSVVRAVENGGSDGVSNGVSQEVGGGGGRRRKNVSEWLQRDDVDVPTPGYSGHVPGIRQFGVGKPFTVAAKECRRKMHASGESADHTHSSTHSHNGSVSHAPAHSAIKAKERSGAGSQGVPSGWHPQMMGSYPFMAPNGMMPMFMPPHMPNQRGYPPTDD